MARIHSALKRRWPPLLAALLCLGLLVWQLAANPAHEERDAVQERLDSAAGSIAPGHGVGQTFLSQHRGLKAVQILLVVYDQTRTLPEDATLTMTLQRQDGTGTPVQVSVPAAGLTHNQAVTFSFEPLSDSRNVTYTLTLTCAADYGLSCWRTDSESYAYGDLLVNGEAQAGDLYFSTTYAYRLTDALQELGSMLGRGVLVLPACLVLLFLPGMVILLYLWPRERRVDPATHVALAVALSVAFWPLLLLWATTLGLRLRGVWLWVPVGALALAGALRLWRAGARRPPSRPGPRGEAPPCLRAERAPLVVLGVVLAVVLGTRMLQVRELEVPAWVDSLHHTVITQLIAEQGQVPSGGEPYLQLGDYHYHFGFQANAAMLVGLSGLPAYRAVLILGQLFNALAALAVYALARWLTRRPWAGVAAALVAGLASNMPAYYVSWGRYTQLAGLLLLPAACLLTSFLLTDERRPWRLFALAGFLLAGLIVVHYRVLVFFGLYCVVYGLVALGRGKLRWPVLRNVAGAGAGLLAVGLALSLPWVLRLSLQIVPNVDTIYNGWEAPEGYNAFPLGLFESGWAKPLAIMAGVGALWGLVRRRIEVVGVAAWTGLWFLAANLHVIGLVDVWLLNNSSAYIATWLPVSLLCGWLVADVPALLTTWLERVAARIPWRRVALSGAVTAVSVAAGWFGWRMVDIVNPVTVLLLQDDLRAITWARDSLPTDARVLVNTRLWDGDIHVGTDGGWWMQLLAGRAVTMPCILYHQGPTAYREAVNSLATLVEQAPSVDDPALLARLEAEGVTHIYVGTRGGRLMPKELDASVHYRAIYVSGPTRIYEFLP